MDSIVATHDLRKSFGKNEALAGISINITKHSITGLIGRNGSGKTTLLKIIAGLLDKSSGRVEVFGEQPMDNLPVLNKLVYTYHNVAYEPNFRLEMILYAYKTMFKNFDPVFANKLMKFFELSGKTKYTKRQG